MKAWIRGLLFVVLLALPCALAETQNPLLFSDGWSYVGYTYGGITFAVPNDYEFYQISAADAAQGYVLMVGDADFLLQLRVFQPNQMSYADFKAIIQQEPTAEISARVDGDSEILIYRNTQPSAINELYGVGMTGLDGLFYKISIFTGDDEDFSADAPVWQIAETVGKTAQRRDFSEWGIEDTPIPTPDKAGSALSGWLKRFVGK